MPLVGVDEKVEKIQLVSLRAGVWVRFSVFSAGKSCYKRAGKKNGVATSARFRYPSDMNVAPC
jgi:hypothetical protein